MPVLRDRKHKETYRLRASTNLFSWLLCILLCTPVVFDGVFSNILSIKLNTNINKKLCGGSAPIYHLATIRLKSIFKDQNIILQSSIFFY